MRVGFDTSVLVPALIETHPRHVRAIRWIQGVQDEEIEGMCAWHAIAETWSVLTRLPAAGSVSPALAEMVIDQLVQQIKPIALNATTYRSAIRRCSERGYRSGAVFDALHMVCAEETGAERFLTFNPRDFERLATSDSPKILVPPDPPAIV